MVSNIFLGEHSEGALPKYVKIFAKSYFPVIYHQFSFWKIAIRSNVLIGQYTLYS